MADLSTNQWLKGQVMTNYRLVAIIILEPGYDQPYSY